MDREDFIERRGNDRIVDFYKYYGLMEAVFCRDYNLTPAMLKLLFYLAAIPYFKRTDFKDGTLYFSWDKRLFNYMLKEGWFVVIKNGYRKRGDHNHYSVSLKGKRLVNNIYRISCGKDDLPEKCKRNRDKKNARFSDKTQKNAIKKMDEDRAKERFNKWDEYM